MITRLTDTIKAYGTSITTIFTIIATIGGAVIYINNNYANAQDVKEILRNQSIQIEMYQRSQRDNLLFKLEFYDREIAKLQEQRRIAEEKTKTRQATRAIEKTPSEIQDEINELKLRRDFIKRSIIAPNIPLDMTPNITGTTK